MGIRPVTAPAAASIPGRTVSPARHAALVLAAYTLLFSWLFSRILFPGVYLSESDLFDWFLPFFLSPPAKWSSDIYAGLPLFADTSDAINYPVQFFFSREIGSWSGYVISAYVIGASLAYAYVFTLTRSRAAGSLAGLAYGLSEAMIERQAHINFVHAFAWFPLMVLAVDRLLSGGSWRWVAVGAAATACCFLAGHPQPILYAASFCAVYGLVGSAAEHAPRSAYVRIAAMFVLGGMLMSIKAVPFLQATQYIGRQLVGYEQFVSHANSPSQMMSLLFPSIAHDGREASLYVGITVLMVAALGATRAGRSWRAALWVATAVIVGLVGAGKSTPVDAAFYLLPIYRRSRIITRMMFIFAFATAVLGGLGIAAVQRRELSRRTIMRTVALMIAVIGGGAVWLATTRASIEFEFDTARLAGLPFWNAGVLIQLTLALVMAGLLIWATIAHRFQVAAVALITVVALDLLHGTSYPVTLSGLHAITVTANELRPSVHARRLATALAPLHQRLLAVSGTTRDAIVPSGFARLWHIPIAGGYSPILLRRLTALATTGNNGDVRTEMLAYDDAALDVLAVRYILVREDDFPTPVTFDKAGLSWSGPVLDMKIGRDDCGFKYPRLKSIHVPAEEVVGIDIVAELRCSEDLPQGTEVGAIEIAGADGAIHRQRLMVGDNVSDRGLSAPQVLNRARHTRVERRFDDPDLSPDVHAVHMGLVTPVRDATIMFRGAPTGAWWAVDRLTLTRPDGTSRPQSLAGLYLGDTRRWREMSRVTTSRHTDRDRDESAPDELEYTIYENLRAMPRAWMATEVVSLDERDMLATVHTMQLPDGRRFDPRQMALVDPGTEQEAHRFDVAPSSATVTRMDDGRITVEVTAPAGGYLVLSESYFPGWRARIGDRVIPVARTDLALQGVAVPPGQHQVVFEIESVTQRAGTAISIVGLVCASFLLVAAGRLDS